MINNLTTINRINAMLVKLKKGDKETMKKIKTFIKIFKFGEVKDVFFIRREISV
jgi:hypothetical protein